MVATQRRSVLIADDDTGVRDSLVEALTRAGWETYPAEGGREAIEVVRVRVVSVAIVDLGMPDLSGFDTVRELHRLVRLLPVIAMTGDRDESLRARAAEAGARELLWKPIERARVLRALEEALRAWGAPPAGA